MENVATNTDKNLVITRTFDAPKELVWQAWTDPEHYKGWWGPRLYSCPACEIDLRVGGKYKALMRGQGNDIWTAGTYLEIVPNELLVYTDSFSDENGNIVSSEHYGMSGIPEVMKVTIKLEERDGQTKMTLIHEGTLEGELRDMTRAGWNESFDKLAEQLAKA